MDGVTDLEKRGLKVAGIAVLAMSCLLALTVVPEGAPLRNPDTGLVAGSPFLKGIVAFIFICFAIPGLVYGKVVGSMKRDVDVINAMSHSMSSMGMYIVLVFFASQFVAFFKWTNLGAVLAVSGADALNAIGLTGPLVFVLFIMMCGFINLMLGSASAQWAVTPHLSLCLCLCLLVMPQKLSRQPIELVTQSLTSLPR